MEANVIEKLMSAIVKAHNNKETDKVANLMVKAEIVLSRKNDASVIQEVMNGEVK